ncbi:Alpha-methylacyl-CoA racemase (plasmid) [Cupriavidus necator H850]|nr:Alpha-methylacyl-CoA racemase [Cupriavidus necator H850]
MEKLGLGPAHCAARNPRLVYGRMIGWGQHGQLAQAAGHDLNYVPLTGLLSLSAHRGQRPIVPPTVVGDANGALGLAFGIACAAASRRQRPGMRCRWSVEQQDIQAAHRMRAILLGYQCGDAARSKSACAGSLAGGHRPRLQRPP